MSSESSQSSSAHPKSWYKLPEGIDSDRYVITGIDRSNFRSLPRAEEALCQPIARTHHCEEESASFGPPRG